MTSTNKEISYKFLRKEFAWKFSNTSNDRQRIYDRDGGMCRYCHVEVITTKMLFKMMDDIQLGEMRKMQLGLVSEKKYYSLNPRKLIENTPVYRQRMATIDHVIPLSKGGTNDEENLVTCCSRCNSKKSCKIMVG